MHGLDAGKAFFLLFIPFFLGGGWLMIRLMTLHIDKVLDGFGEFPLNYLILTRAIIRLNPCSPIITSPSSFPPLFGGLLFGYG